MKTTMNRMKLHPVEQQAKDFVDLQHYKHEAERVIGLEESNRRLGNENVCLKSQLKSLLAEKKAGMWGPKLFIAFRRDITKDLEKYSKRFATKSAKSRPKSV